jgi:WD40 repeat protein
MERGQIWLVLHFAVRGAEYVRRFMSNFMRRMFCLIRRGQAFSASRSQNLLWATILALLVHPSMAEEFTRPDELYWTINAPGNETDYGVFMSPNGRYLVSGSQDRFKGRDTLDAAMSIKLWDSVTGRLMHILKGHAKPITSLAFSYDGSELLTGSEDKSIKVWDALKGRQITTIRVADPVTSVAFSPDSKQIVVAGIDAFYLYDSTGEPFPTFRFSIKNVKTAIFSPTGRYLLADTGECHPYPPVLTVWDTATRKLLLTLNGFYRKWSPDDHLLVIRKCEENGAYSGEELWDVEDGKLLMTTSVFGQFSPDGKTILARDKKGTLVSYDPRIPVELNSFGSSKFVNASSYGTSDHLPDYVLSQDGRRLAIAEKTITFWNPRTGQLVLTSKEPGTYSYPEFSPDGHFLAAAIGDEYLGKFVLLNADTGETIRRFRSKTGQLIWGFSFLPDGSRLLSYGHVGGVELWNVNTGRRIKTFDTIH